MPEPEPERDARWLARRNQIPMLVQSAEAKRPAPAPPPATVVDVLVDWLHRRYQPVFRENGWHFWSGKLGQLVRPGEIMPDLDVIETLATHPDAARDNKGKVKQSALPALFRTWLSVAFNQLLDSLPPEEAATTICPHAAGRLRKRLQLLMATPVSLSFRDNVLNERVTRIAPWHRGIGALPSRFQTNGAASAPTIVGSPASMPGASDSPSD